MKTLTTYFFIGLFFSFHCFVYGQFNTLIPIQPKKTENLPIVEKTDETKDLKQKSDKKFWKAIFNTTSKADLKKELDSLKTMIKENSENNNKKWRIQKIQDSLILQLQSQVIINEQKRTTSITRNDYENETGELKLSKIAMPLSRSVSLKSPYGMRIHPLLGRAKMHNGIDLKANYENVYAVMDGMVTATGWDPKGGGNYIKVKHYNRFETSYLHLSEIYYRTGDPVKAGYIIAKSGNSGNSTGAHLHFAVRENGNYINPIRFLNDLIEANHWLATSYQN
ncbi:M23 family metallopeptidase [Epilithonimonas pallida]|uniref:Murein DD-endopeptidase MepM and murein hydrolase activator NlpD, contain LysM domain n=1 Tax=Epilithonimonas pallida TaxID=373671 RepID=A0ABY1R488_9FLAO|nr:M23 family metallopeptidase [Epilithonimonas pallida]SMP93800.1 Murein DD-endopeptidase MepM and murein hydrolase activator NlpD, contain LysM domain [Epilithonimonas pallida]